MQDCSCQVHAHVKERWETTNCKWFNYICFQSAHHLVIHSTSLCLAAQTSFLTVTFTTLKAVSQAIYFDYKLISE